MLLNICNCDAKIQFFFDIHKKYRQKTSALRTGLAGGGLIGYGGLADYDFGGGGALAADEDAVGWVGYLLTVEVVVFYRRVGVD